MTQILHWNGNVLFEGEGDCREVLQAAVKAKADLSGVNLPWANLHGANLHGANLHGANLSGANLSGAYLIEADLSCANLYGANLSWAYLIGANLYGANLIGVNLSGANLHGAQLSGAKLHRAKLSGTIGVDPNRSTSLRMLLDQPGKIRAYKLVDADYLSPLQSDDKLKYEIGTIVSVENANTDENQDCAAGVNVADSVWVCANWKDGYHILLVEFTRKAIACVPIASNGKFRLHKCKVIREIDPAEWGLRGTPL